MQAQPLRQATTESRLLLGKPRRRRWPRKTATFIRTMNMSAHHTKSIQQEISLAQPNSISSIHDSIHASLSGYPFTLLLAYYIGAVLYNPCGVAAKFVKDAFGSILNLPPFFTWVVFPFVAVYLVNHSILFLFHEYQSFLDLGRGGTPRTPMGLLKVSLKKFCAQVDVLDPPHVDPMLEPYRGVLFDLEVREGERPIVKGVAPQRQFDQRTPASTFIRLLEMMKDAASKDGELVVTTSYLEGHTEALKARFEDLDHEILGTDGEWDFEIAHPHRIDGSMHMVLHPEDARTIIEHGWGEKHPLATNALYWQFYYHRLRGKRRPVPYNLVLCYAPRNNREFAIMKKILDAAIWFHKERAMYERVTNGAMVRLDNGTVISRRRALDEGLMVGEDGRLIAPAKCENTKQPRIGQ